ncbi:MAG: L,D-transpeptidase, partial [Patescibacteria group bacterium]|nr:L,D-transpeptidase [Patescibacteria group bacterium]
PTPTSPEATRSLAAAAAAAASEIPAPPLSDFIEVTGSCNIHYASAPCIIARAEPSATSSERATLRNGIVLEVATTTVVANGHTWYRVLFNDYVRYPERVVEPWYVAADTVRHFEDVGDEFLIPGTMVATTTRYIVIDLGKQALTAFDNGVVFLQTPVSTGLELTPTPRGTFMVLRKTPSSYMQGPLPDVSDQYYDLPGVPWDLYFTETGSAIHGAYWHNAFGQEWSHGCVNTPYDAAHILYDWAPLGTPVYVID